jgi:hypothetical protein
MAIGMRLTGLSMFIAMALVGCRDTLDATATGTVWYEEKPVPFAVMNFHFQGRGPMAYAVTEENGSYELFSGSKRGLVPGKYRVAIESLDGVQLPKKYSAIDTSGLEYDVKEGANRIDIQLK